MIVRMTSERVVSIGKLVRLQRRTDPMSLSSPSEKGMRKLIAEMYFEIIALRSTHSTSLERNHTS